MYLALYPPDCTSLSPVKTSNSAKSGRGAQSLAPTPATSEAAYDALSLLSKRIPPRTLLQALPSYPAIGETRRASPLQGTDSVDHAEESMISRESARFTDCINCWKILKEGFVPPLSPVERVLPGSPRKKSARGATSFHSSHDQEPAIVGERSWPMLEYLITLFEKDELQKYNESGGALSPLLSSTNLLLFPFQSDSRPFY